MSLEKFKETVELIRSKCDTILNLTTSGDLNVTDEERMAHLIELKTELASFDAGSNWMHNSLFLNPPHYLEKLGKTMLENDVKPEIEIFDAGMV
jgi:3-keto-5-aminohexanoate cleavage enzyme